MHARPPTSRIVTIDAIRGFAVLGILLMNIVAFGLPTEAYFNPQFYGGDTGANWWAWALTYVFADGKMRGLFTLLFGASVALVAQSAIKSGRSAALVHYGRLATLLLIGLIHAYLIWAGDILVLYALCGSLAFVVWRVRTLRLVAMGVILLLVGLGIGIHSYRDALDAVHAADSKGMTADMYLAGYGGNWASVMALRSKQVFWWFPSSLSDTLAMMFIGMALLKSGFLAGAWSRQRYVQLAVGGLLVAALLHIPLIGFLERHAFSKAALILSNAIQLNLLRPAMCLAQAAIVILLVQSGWAAGLFRRLEAVGQMALSNYLGTSIVCTTLFYGTGFGLYGKLERWELYGVVFLVWIAIMLWSLPWLKYHRQGPVEWGWRCMTQRRWEPLRRRNMPQDLA